MKKLMTLVTLVLTVFILTGCWYGEIGVTTEFNIDGSGSRTIVIEVVDDTLSDEPIINFDKPDGDNPINNSKYFQDQNILAIQDWLLDNAPSFMTVHEVKTEGYFRYFTVSYSWTSFEDFLAKHEILVNLSPTLSWDVIPEEMKPTFTVEGFFEKTATFTESREMLLATLDWAIDGIYNDVYDDYDSNGKENIWRLAKVNYKLGDGQYVEERYHDPESNGGEVIFITDTSEFEVTGTGLDVMMVTLVSVAGVVVLVGLGVGAFFIFKKKPVKA